MTDNKSLTFTYIFSLIGGLFGLHHLYLGRTQHALLWFTTFGGFGIGFIYEFFFLLKKYVHETNHDLLIVNEYKLKMIQRKSPAFEILRLCGKKKKNQMKKNDYYSIIQILSILF
jgi:DnaJ family protein C protein 22